MVAIYTSPQPGVSRDANAIMMFEANKKSLVLAYLLWFFFGSMGGHRFYAGKNMSAVGQLVMPVFAISLLTTGAFIAGLFVLMGLSIWILVDAFFIPGWISDKNSLLATQLGQQGPASGSSLHVAQGSDGGFGDADQLIARYQNTQSGSTTRAAPSVAGFGKRRVT